MRLIKQTTLALASCLFISSQVFAGEVTIPNTFTAGETAVAADVNADFTAVKTAVDDNNARITNNATDISTNTDSISAIMQPLVLAVIDTDSTIRDSAGTPFTCEWNSSYKRYEITIEGVNVYLSHFVVVATPMGSFYSSSDSVNGKLLIYLHSPTDTLIQGQFSLAVFGI